MAELTMLESKMGEVIGLAMAAQGVAENVAKLLEDEELRAKVEQVRAEAAQTEERGTELLAQFEGKKTAILEKARETKQEATEMMSTYLGDDADALDGFEFLTMAEAGESGHWSVLGKLNERAGNRDLQSLIDWVKPIQDRHFEDAMAGSLALAGREDPNAAA